MKQQLKKTKRDPIIQNFQNLTNTVSKAQAKNLAKYNQIKYMNPDFQFKLYKPVIPSYQTRQELGLAQQIMLRQIDKLMQDEQKLNLQLNRHQIKAKEQQRKKEKQIMLSMDHFTFLRKMWKKDQTQTGIDNKVDKLIHNVGSIKGHIFNIIKKQNQISHSSPQIHELVISSPQYCELLKKYQQLKQQYKAVQEKPQPTNSTAQNSLQSEQIKKYNEELEEELAGLKIELANKNIMLENMKILQNRLFEGENENSQWKKVAFYSINSHDGTYNIYIQEKQRKGEETEQNGNETDTKQAQTKQFTSKQSLQAILKFLQGSEPRRPSKLAETTNQEVKTRRITVQELAKPKFISNRIMHHKSP